MTRTTRNAVSAQSKRIFSAILLTTTFCLGLLVAPQAKATEVNFNSLEVVLSSPNDRAAIDYALWSGWTTQVLEYNMPFIEIANAATDPALTEFRMSIGDTAFNFSNEFSMKEKTNSFNIPANGEYALLGVSTPGISLSSAIADGGDTLVVSFGNGGLQPGQTVRFQVDIDSDDPHPSTADMHRDFTSVFFQGNTADQNDLSKNSVMEFYYAGQSNPVTAVVPDHMVKNPSSTTTPRPYSVMQMENTFDGIPIAIPEPAAALLLMVGVVGVAARSRR